jgi:hypothetical protein
MKIPPLKLSVAKTGITHVSVQHARVWYIRAMDLRLTTKGFTGKVDLRTYQCVWYLSTLIAYDNPNVLEHLETAMSSLLHIK